MNHLSRSLILIAGLAFSLRSHAGALTDAVQFFDPKPSDECSQYLNTAEQMAGTDIASKWTGQLIHKFSDRFFHNSISSIELGDGLSTSGLVGRFLGQRIVPQMTSEANRMLVRVLKDPALSEQLGKQLVKLGLMPHDSKHFDFAKFLVLSRNEPIDLTRPKLNGRDVTDPVVLQYLKTLTVNNQTALTPDSSRDETLRSLFLTALSGLDNNGDEYKKSIKSLDMAFVELSQLEREGRLTPHALADTFDKLIGTAEFTVKNYNIPGWARPIAGVVPYLGVAFKVWDTVSNAITYIFSQDTGLQNVRREVSKVDGWHKRTPNSVRIQFVSRDVRNLKPVVDQFISKYAAADGPAVFSAAFASDFLSAYPEVSNYFSGFYSTEVLPVTRHAGESFAGYHPEVQKMLFKAANFFSILRNDTAIFSEIEPEQLKDLRSQMVADLELANGDGGYNVDQIDLVFTSFITTALGKAQNPLIDSISEDFDIDNHVGHYSPNRRALFLLHHYRLLSYSFSRQSAANQKFLTEIMDSNYQSSLMELLRLESPPPNFELLHQLEAHHLNFLFYQHLLAESKESRHRMTIAPHVLERWLKLKALLVRDTNPAIAVNGAYLTYVGWLGEGTPLNLRNEWDFVALRVATMMGIPDSEISKLKQEMSLLNPEEQELFLTFLYRQSIFLHGGSDLFKAILYRNSEENRPLVESMDDFLSALNSIFISIRDQHYHFARITSTNETISLFLKPVIEKIQEDLPIEQLSRMKFDLQHNPYGDVVHLRQ